MARLTLAERLEKAAQKKARAGQEEARLKLMQRKERTRSLIELGGLVAKAGLDELSPTALYGSLIRIAEEAKDPNTILLWEREGARLFQAEDDSRVAAVARFPAAADRTLTAALRKLGFRWNRILGHWEGRVLYDEAEAMVAGAGGTMTKIEAP